MNRRRTRQADARRHHCNGRTGQHDAGTTERRFTGRRDRDEGPGARWSTGRPGPRVGIPGALPRGLIIVLVAAAIVVVVAGMRAIPGILGPVFLALVLTILVDPIRGLLLRHHAPRWLASIAAFLAGLLIVVGLVVAAPRWASSDSSN